MKRISTRQTFYKLQQQFEEMRALLVNMKLSIDELDSQDYKVKKDKEPVNLFLIQDKVSPSSKPCASLRGVGK